MTEPPRDPRDPFAPPDAVPSAAPSSYPPPAFPPPAGPQLPPPAWTGDPYGAPVAPSSRRRGWIIAAAVVGGLVAVGVIGAAAVSVLGGALEQSSTSATGEVWISEVPAGRCYILDDADRREDLAGYVTLVDCRFAHDGQVYGVVPLDFDAWPGQRAVSDAAGAGCREKDALLDEEVFDASGLSGSWYTPFEEDWDVEAHTAQCVVESDGALGLTRSWLKADASPAPSA